MILQRLAASIRKQDWFTVLIETLIVVLGVFLGIQLGNWNAERANAKLGEEYVSLLARETQVNLDGTKLQAAYYDAVLDSVIRTDELLRQTDPDPRDLIVNAYRGTEVSYITPERATWDQIVSSGHLSLLPKDAVESGLSQFYAFDTAQDMYQLGLNSTYRVTARQIIPMHMQIAMRETCSDLRNDEGDILGFMDSCDFDADPDEIEAIALALHSDPVVAATLTYHYSMVISAKLNLGGVATSLEDALARLGSPVTPEAAP